MIKDDETNNQHQTGDSRGFRREPRPWGPSPRGRPSDRPYGRPRPFPSDQGPQRPRPRGDFAGPRPRDRPWGAPRGAGYARDTGRPRYDSGRPPFRKPFQGASPRGYTKERPERRLRPNYLLVGLKNLSDAFFQFLKQSDHEFYLGTVRAPGASQPSLLETQCRYFENALQALRKSKILLQQCGHVQDASLHAYGKLGFKYIHLDIDPVTAAARFKHQGATEDSVATALAQIRTHIDSLHRAGYQVSTVDFTGPIQNVGPQILEVITNTRWL